MSERLNLMLNAFRNCFCFSQLEVEISELREKAKQTPMKTDDTALR